MAPETFAERCLQAALGRLRGQPAYGALGPTLARYARSYSAARWSDLAAAGSEELGAADALLGEYAGWVWSVLGPRKAEVVIRRAGLDGQEPRGTRTVAEELRMSRSTVRRYERLALHTLGWYARKLPRRWPAPGAPAPASEE